MKIEKSVTINGEIVVEAFKTKTITFYRSKNGEDKHFIVNNSSGNVECYIDVDPFCGEGGGGSIEFHEII